MFNYWTATWAVGFCTPYLVDDGTKGGGGVGVNIAYMWFGLVVITTAWAYLCLPELRRLSFTQVDLLFESRVPAWRSVAWQRSLGSDLDQVPVSDDFIDGMEVDQVIKDDSIEKA